MSDFQNRNDSILLSNSELFKSYNFTEECLKYYESIRITSDRRDFHKTIIRQIENFLVNVNQRENKDLLNIKFFNRSFSRNNLENINDYIYYLYKTLFIIFVDEFAIDKAYESYKNLNISINNSSFAQKKEETTTLDEPLFDFAKRLYLIGQIKEANELYDDFEKRYFIAKSIGLGYDTYYCELKEILGETRVTHFVINHQVQLDNLKRLGYLDEKREKQVSKRFQKTKNEKLKLEDLLKSFLEYPGFIPKTPYEKVQSQRTIAKYIPEPSYSEYYYENLSTDQKNEYNLTYRNNTDLKAVIKYKYIRLGCLLRTLIFHPTFLKYEEVINECIFFSNISTKTVGASEASDIIKFCNYLSFLSVTEKSEILNCLRLLHNKFETIIGMPLDRDMNIPESIKKSGFVQHTYSTKEFIPESGNSLYPKFCIIPLWTYIENAMLPLDKLKSYLTKW